MNKLVVGKKLSSTLSVPLIGYVAQIISCGLSYHSLEGPVFGTRIGVYHNTTATTESGFVPLTQDQDDKEKREERRAQNKSSSIDDREQPQMMTPKVP